MFFWGSSYLKLKLCAAHIAFTKCTPTKANSLRETSQEEQKEKKQQKKTLKMKNKKSKRRLKVRLKKNRGGVKNLSVKNTHREINTKNE